MNRLKVKTGHVQSEVAPKGKDDLLGRVVAYASREVAPLIGTQLRANKDIVSSVQ